MDKPKNNFEKALEDIVEEQLGELENIDIDTID